MFGGVAGRGDDPKGQAAEVELFSVTERPVPILELCSGWSPQFCSEGHQFATAGDEIGVEMSLDDEASPQSSPVQFGQIGPWVPFRIDDESPTVSEFDQIGAVAQPFIDYAGHLHWTPTFSNDSLNNGSVVGLSQVIV
jgi:hypothetical protein